jgi:cation diffusion facilitator family transporter
VDWTKHKQGVALLSVLSNTTLVAGKLVVGLLIGSVSVLSEAIHSGVDLVASLIAWFAVRTADKPADEGHPFGHGKVENLSGTIEALLIFVAAGWIIYEAVGRLLHPRPIEGEAWGALVMGVSAVANLAVSQLLFKVGRATDSVALEADAWHLRTDVYTSAGVMVGLAVMALDHRLLPGAELRWVDPVAALAVAALILRAAYELTLKSARDLMDVRLPEGEEAWMRAHVASLAPRVLGFHRLRTRKAGAYRFVDFHLLVDPEMTVRDSHAIAEDVTATIRARLPRTSVTVHVEPCDGRCLAYCVDGCLLPEDKRRAVREALAAEATPIR